MGLVTARREGHVECPESEPANDDIQFSRSGLVPATDCPGAREARVRYAVGNYDYYLEKRAEEQRTVQPKEPSVTGKPVPPITNRPRKLKWKKERELETIESVILEAEDEVAALEKIFADPNFYQKHGQNYAALARDLETARDRVSELHRRWEEQEQIKQESAGSKPS